MTRGRVVARAASRGLVHAAGRRGAALRGLLLVLGVAGPAAGQPPVATLQVTVANVRSDRGHVLVAVCPRESFLRPTCAWRGSAPARVGAVVVVVQGMPPGVYAVQSYLDENDDHRLNRSLLGIPTEGMGFSNDAAFRFGPPAFDEAAVRVAAGVGAISLRLRYF